MRDSSHQPQAPKEASASAARSLEGTAVRRRIGDLSVLYELTAALAGTLDSFSGLSDFAQKLRTALAVDIVSVLARPDGDGGEGEGEQRLELLVEAPARSAWANEATLADPPQALDATVLDEVEARPEGRLPIDRRTLGTGRELANFMAARGVPVACGAAQAIRSDRGQTGLLLVGRTANVPLGERELELLGILTERLSSAMDHVRVQKDLTESERKFRKLMQSAVDPILLYDPVTRQVVEFNDAAAEFFGLDAQRRRPQRPGSGLAEYLGELEGLSVDQLATPRERSVGGSGNERFFEARAGQVELQGSSLLLVSTRDMTERRRMELELEEARCHAERAVEAKSRFLATLSHEVRTPLSGLIGLAQLLERSKLDGEQRAWARTMVSSAEALLGIVNGVLDFAKLEAGRVELERVPLDVRETVGDVAQLMGQVAREKGVVLRWQVGSDVPHGLLGDPLRLRQVLINLTSNAIKFTADGWVELRARLVGSASPRGAAPTCRLRFEVEDSGIGIPADVASNLFQRFAQAERSTERQYGGTGLGLSICKELVELQGGQIGLETELDQGTCFWFELSFRRSVQPALPEPQAPVPRRARAALEVLVVEDNAVNRMVTSRFLDKLGHRVTLAEHGGEALDRLGERPFDLVLMDCQMPVMDGFEAVTRLRSQEARTGEHTPIIALTANVLERDRERCREVGMDGFLSKPMRIDELRSAIDEVLGKLGPAGAGRRRGLRPTG